MVCGDYGIRWCRFKLNRVVLVEFSGMDSDQLNFVRIEFD